MYVRTIKKKKGTFMKKEYTWYPDNQERFSEVFDSIEQAIENAQKKID